MLVALLAVVCGGAVTRSAELPDVEVRSYKGRPMVFIDGEPDALAAYSPSTTKEFYDKYMPLFYRKAGLHVYAIWLENLPDDYYGKRFWVGETISSTPLVEDSDRMFTVDEQVAHILAGDPRAMIIVRFYTRGPRSWKKDHSDEYFVNEEGDVRSQPSLASDVFWGKAAELSGAIVEYCENRPWSSHVIGYNPHYIDEGSHVPVADGWMYDHNPLMKKKLRDFLRNSYGTVAALRLAYGDSTITFETVSVPKDRLRGPLPEVSQLPYWQAPADNRPLRDYLLLTRDLWHRRFRQVSEAMAGGTDREVLFLCDAHKQTMLGWNLKGFFGYPGFGEKLSWSPAFPELMAGSGHMDVAGLLEPMPGFNSILTPHDYQARGVGGIYEPEGIADSAVLRGLHFYAEMDTRSGDAGIGAARDAREWAAITWRNYATSWTRGFSSYWMHGFRIADWFHIDDIQDTIQRQVEVVNQSLEWEHETPPGIAMILDDSAVLETNGSGNFYNEAIMWEWKQGLARCGLPFRIYLLEDLALENFPDHRVFYFPNLFRADEKRMALLRDKVFRDGHLVVWGPGSGIADGDSIGTKGAERLTGFFFDLLPANAPRRILVSNFDHPVTAGLRSDMVIGGPLAYGPILIPSDGTELGAAWVKGGFNRIGMSFKEFGAGAGIGEGRGVGDYAAVFMTAVQVPADLWRNMARYAGAHVYCETNDVLLADNAVVALHSLKSEKKRIRLPAAAQVTDLVSGEKFPGRLDEIVFDLKAPETRVFLIEK